MYPTPTPNSTPAILPPTIAPTPAPPFVWRKPEPPTGPKERPARLARGWVFPTEPLTMAEWRQLDAELTRIAAEKPASVPYNFGVAGGGLYVEGRPAAVQVAVNVLAEGAMLLLGRRFTYRAVLPA